MASAARPRPRPRARVKPVEEASSSTADGPSPVIPVVVDDDAMFIRNQGRNTSTWKKLENLNKGELFRWSESQVFKVVVAKSKQKAARSDSEGDSDSPRPKKQKKKTGDNAQAKINRYARHFQV
jgi:hypothetical protein